MALYSSRWQQFLDHLYRNRRKATACRSNLSKRGLRLESLEERRLLSVSRVFLNPTNSKITFVGSEVADTAVVSETLPGVINVSFQHDGQLTQESYEKSLVSSIIFFGNGGDDSFTNTTSLSVKAFGGLGNDTIVGGSGMDELFGEDGDDTLVGGTGDDSIKGGVGNDALHGQAGDDYLAGESGDDSLYGGSGNDRLYGHLGNDRLEGGAGDDVAFGDDGNDILLGNEGHDRLDGEEGADHILGGSGNDVLSGGDDNDILLGDSGSDNLGGGAGDDVLAGGIGADYLNGQSGDDQLSGGDDDDKLYGGSGNDMIAGNSGDDSLYGEEGADRLYGDIGDDYLSGGDQEDVLYGGLGQDFLTAGAGNDQLYGEKGVDSLYGFEGSDRLHGGEDDDRIYGGTGDDTLLGGGGNDRLYGEEGSDRLEGDPGDDLLDGGIDNDSLSGGEGRDQLVGGDGSDQLEGAAGDDSLTGGEGSDRLLGGPGDDLLRGSEGNDLLLGEEGADLLYGDAGNDVLIGSSGDDFLSGDVGNDYLSGGDGQDYLSGGTGSDAIYGGSDKDELFGGAGGDVLAGGTHDDNLHGGEGSDYLLGNEGEDGLYGDEGTDSLLGGDGDDYLSGGDQDDILQGGAGDDFLTAGSGNDTLYGQSGNDSLFGFEGDDFLFGGDGNDTAFGHQGNDLLFGEDGDDRLMGEQGADLLLGGQGADELQGGDGQDLLIGGSEVDTLSGGRDEDVLIGTSTTHDLPSLVSLHEIWSSDASFARRIDDIQDLPSVGLRLNVTVLDDHVVDQVYGGTESDWILLPGIHATFDPFGSYDHTNHAHSHSHGTVIDHLPAVEGFDLIDSLDSLPDLATEDVLHTLIPHAEQPSKRLEHLALFELVRYDQVTAIATESGDWSDPDLWSNGVVPQAGARVLIPVGVHVEVDEVMPQELATIRVDGTLSFSRYADTELRVDTVVVSEMGRFEMGTAASPIPATETARLVFTDDGAINRDWDPFGISRGLITHGAVEIHGAETTAHIRVTGALAAGARTLTLQGIPVGWDVGDQIVIAGSSSEREQSEQRTILGIAGNKILIDALEYDHVLPTTSGGVHVANLTRNVVLTSEGDDIAHRGHTMFMHNRDVKVNYAQFDKLGRTNKLVPINDAVVDEHWNLEVGTGTNNRARYAIHFHRNGTLANSAPSTVHGSVVTNNAGWGYVNHSSYVHFTNNVAYDVTGAAFSTEVGDEIGSFQGNLAIDVKGSGEESNSREQKQDFGHGGDGFWFQGAGIRVIDNVAADAEGSAYFYYTRGFRFGSKQAHFPTASLTDPSIASGADSILVDHVPVSEFRDNIGYGSDVGLSVRYHLRTAPHNATSVLSDSQFWNNITGVDLPYTNNVVLDNLEIRRELVEDFVGIGVDSNLVTSNITYKDLSVSGYYWAIDVAPRGDSVIDGGEFQAIASISIQSAAAHNRTVVVRGNPVFESIPSNILGPRVSYGVHLRFDTSPSYTGIQHLFMNDTITLDFGPFQNQRVYYGQQDPNAVPFPTAMPQVPSQYVGLTSQQLFDQFGLIIGGEFAPANVTTEPGIAGLVGLPDVAESSSRETRLDWRVINR